MPIRRRRAAAGGPGRARIRQPEARPGTAWYPGASRRRGGKGEGPAFAILCPDPCTVRAADVLNEVLKIYELITAVRGIRKIRFAGIAPGEF
jgi:hypothetical protein